MMRRVRALVRQSLLILVSVASFAAAQGAVTVTGHISAASMPVRGATIRIESLNLGATSNAEGRFSFIVPSARVLGQTVPLTASHPRYRSKSISVVLIGASIEQDFDLGDPGPDTPPRVDQPRVTDTGARNPTSVVSAPESPAMRSDARISIATFRAPAIDSAALTDLAGPIDFAAALAGRFAALDVRSASTLGGTSSMLVRGAHTMSGLTEPLVVVNGIVFDNSNITNLLQQSGLGGFDYGTGTNDLNVEDIASVQLLTGALAAMRYGGRAANGVLLVTTRSARGLHGLEISASQSYSNASVIRLPDYQNAYGQGLGGKFAFFDGKGGGVNDNTSQSWGPALDGSIVLQASYTEAARNNARAFLPVPGNVASYFQGGRTLGTNVALQRGGDRGQFRASFSNRSSRGITPQSSVGHRSGLFTGSARPTDKLSVTADLQAYTEKATDRAGTGFDESNPVAGFAILPRQIDVPVYRIQLRDLTRAQLSWNYSGRNNPFWASLVNDNHDSRTRYVVGGTASYALTDQVTATLRGGSDHGSQDRSFTVAPGWMGGFPYYLGRGDFSRGGFQTDAINTTLRDVEASLRFAPQSSGPLQTAYTLGVGHHSDLLETTIRAKADLGDTTSVKDVPWSGSSSTNVLFGRAESRIDDRASLAVSARSEASTLMSGSSVSTVYPSVTASFDLLHPDLTANGHRILESLTLQGGFSRSGNEGTGALLQRLGVTTATSAALVSDVAAPEVTTGIEGGASMQMYGGRLGFDVSVYRDRSENLIVPSGIGFLRTASLTNKGVEATATLAPLQGPSALT
ncbi:MAG: TonB-dependent receptor, partial [Gemmatimonadota bacterium]|nr:TonB-dependent receptor [Gemmatimonadota bacterium]